jgi:hypothetical protein
MNAMMKPVSGLICAVGLFAASTARADIPPPDVCHTENATCHNAGTNYDQDGVCAAATCSKGSATGQVTTYECMLCKSDALLGAAGASEVASASDDHKDDGGCNVRALGTEKGIATVMLGFGLLALGISRRRR